MKPPADLKASLLTKSKKVVQPSAVGASVSYQGRTPILQVRGGRFALDPPDAPGPTAAEVVPPVIPAAIQQKYGAYMGAFKFGRVEKNVATLPPKNDHRARQTPIKNQASRGTCVAHAAIAGMEAAYRKKGLAVELSENHAYNLFMAQVGSNCFNDEGVPTWRSAAWLTSAKTCTEADSPYVTHENNTNPTCAVIQPACNNNRKYGFTNTVALFGTEGGAGLISINNTNVLEAFIDAGFDIVGGFYLAGTNWSDGTAESGVIDVQMTSGPNGLQPIGGTGGHAMLIVGYDRPGEYFILKNSYGVGFGHDGYAYVSYDYMQTYAKYGYAVLDVATP